MEKSILANCEGYADGVVRLLNKNDSSLIGKLPKSS